MTQLKGHADFNPASDIPSLKGKVILVTGGKFSRMHPSHQQGVSFSAANLN